MMRLAMALALLLLAGPIDPRTTPMSPQPGGAHVDRHVEAHVPAREGDAGTGAPDTRSDRDVAPDPAPGTGVFQSAPPPPPFQNPRDPLYRDRRF